jgi:hypothetical protein
VLLASAGRRITQSMNFTSSIPAEGWVHKVLLSPFVGFRDLDASLLVIVLYHPHPVGTVTRSKCW